ncbi:MAG TPA: aminoacyl-tRNA hydrolase [Candidatus Paceibacterota bacterium]|jgi:PTH1 family peptidyl-tRNA hydrolase|nr:aminoacyl-tRNA hydrolase [Parcubacteria group bacterium]MDP6119657.1 aminoacyl-tRNA hydrolase [Candidatus Paceibacterota bacterium]HJN62755.1 aminoacyl-tRNA hydrolase [Candidatus Paceibacterota bacterium]|tara:strand:- start:3494 stop:4084 length:591 start_codon:yes stop_codon:yes gene_type:complete
MNFVITGLGNPGEEYQNTRHNVGWTVLDKIWKDFGFKDWYDSAKGRGELSEGEIGKEKVLLLKPHTMMNNSGKAVASIVRNKKSAKNLIVLHDDLDLPIGSFKIIYNHGPGGHRGVKSVQRALGTNEFVRIKIGISPTATSGKVRKPKGDQKVLDFIIGDFRKSELEKIKKVSKDISGAIESIILDGCQLAMTDWN